MTTTVTADNDATVDAERRRLSWTATVPAGERWSATIRVRASLAPEPAPYQHAGHLGWRPVSVHGRPDLQTLLAEDLEDLAAFAVNDAVRNTVLATGDPRSFAVVGHEALWAARMLVPLSTGLASGTLRTLASRQGRCHDPATGEAPGAVPSAIVDDGQEGRAGYHGLDATALWVCLLREAWAWGMPIDDVITFLEPLEAALTCLVDAAGKDGLVPAPRPDAATPDVARPCHDLDPATVGPVTATNVTQAYAYQAGVYGAELLESFGRPGAARMRAWAQAVRAAFAAAFWTGDRRGAFPAAALGPAGRPYALATSSLGHLLGTGLLTADEAAIVAERLARPDLDAGNGLRTLSGDDDRFNPFGRRTGSVWPRETAIAVRGLVREGHGAVAAKLANGLLDAAGAFGHRLPDYFAGTDRRQGDPTTAHPHAPRAVPTTAASSFAIVQAALGLDAGVPGELSSTGHSTAFAEWFPLRIDGLQVSGHPLSVVVDAQGRLSVGTDAAITVRPSARAAGGSDVS